MVLGDIKLTITLLERLRPVIGDGPELRAFLDRLRHLLSVEEAKRKTAASTLNFTTKKS